MGVVLLGYLNIVMAEKLGDGVNIDAAHDKIRGKGRTEHFKVNSDTGFLGVTLEFLSDITFKRLPGIR